jgi:hypothetical protein
MIFGPKDDGTYVVEFRTAAGEALAISIPRTECAVIRHFQERVPYGLSESSQLECRVPGRRGIGVWSNRMLGGMCSVPAFA